MIKQTVLACAGLNPDAKPTLCEKSDECAHYEEWWTAEELTARKVDMNLCTQAGGHLKMFTPWRPLIQAGAQFEFMRANPQGDLFA